MDDKEMQNNTEIEWNLESAELAYGVIARYVEHTQISGIIIAMMASVIGEDRLGTVAQSEYWQSYMDSKRSITEARADIDKLTALLEHMRKSEK